MDDSEFHRLKRLPPYVFAEVNAMKARARGARQDVIDLGMGNPDLPTAPHIVAKLAEAAANPRAHGYSASRGIPGLRKAQAAYYARRFGVELDPEKVTTHEWAVATAPIETPVGVIEPGTVAAQRFTWSGTVDGRPVITAAVNWLMGEEHLDPAWAFGPEGERFEVRFDADPPLHVVFHGLHPESVQAGIDRNAGVVATAQHCVNAIPSVCAAEPGIRTYLDLEPIAGRLAR